MPRYNEIVMDHFEDPRNRGSMEQPDVVGVAHLRGAQGPFVQLFLRIADQSVQQVRFQARGCGYTIAAMSLLTELLEDQPLARCREITREQIDEGLGGLPSDKAFCAGLAHLALENALSQVLAADDSPPC